MIRKTHPCPTCSEQVSKNTHPQFFPFCSERCRTIDLGNWLDESYRVPTDEGDSSDLT